MKKHFLSKLLTTLLATISLSTTSSLISTCGAEVGPMAQKAITQQIYGDILSSKNPLLKVKKDGKWGMLTATGKEVIPCNFGTVRVLPGNLGLIGVTQKEKWGLYKQDGVELIPPSYDRISPYSQDLLLVEQDKKKGIITTTGKIVIPVEMLNIKIAYNDNIIMVQKDKNTWAFYTLAGAPLFTKSYRNIQGASEGLISVVNDKKLVGFIDTTGKEIIAPTYKQAFDFAQGFTLVEEQDDKLALINKTGAKIAQLPGKELSSGFSEGIALVREGKNFSAINSSGKTIFTIKANNVAAFKNGTAAIERKVNKMNLGGLAASVLSIAVMGGNNLSFGFGSDGSFSLGVMDPYYYGHSFDHRYYDAGYRGDLTFGVNYKDYKLGYIDKTGKEIIPTKNDFNSVVKDDKVLVKVNGKYGYVNTQGQVLVPAEYDDISYFTATDPDIVAVGKDDKYAFYQIGKGIVSRWYAKVKPYSEGLAAVDFGEDNWVYINRSGNRIGQISKYKKASDYAEGLAVVGIGNKKLAVLDQAGNKIVATTDAYKNIGNCHGGLLPIQDAKGKWGFLNKQGQVVVPPVYDDYKI